MCRWCYRKEYEKTQRMKPKEPLLRMIYKKRCNIPSRKKKPNMTEKWLMQHWGYTSQVELFDEMWEENKNPVCPFTAVPLNVYRDTEMRYHCCAHILPKGNYPYFKLNKDNIRLVLPAFHTSVDQGTKEDRHRKPMWKFREWDRLVEEMKVKYEEFKKEHLL